MEDKTIDKNKKYPPMENLTDAGKKSSARSGLQKLKRIRDEMFKKRHQSLKEEDENKQNQENSPAGILFLFCITHPTRYSCVHYPKENIIRKIKINKIKKKFSAGILYIKVLFDITAI